MSGRRQQLISVHPYDDFPYWGMTPFWQGSDSAHPGCVSMDPFGTNQMAAVWATHDELPDEACVASMDADQATPTWEAHNDNFVSRRDRDD